MSDRAPTQVEEALVAERLETQKYITLAKRAEAEKYVLELQEYKAMVESAQASNFRHRTYDFVAPILEPTIEQAQDILTRWARQSTEPITIRFTSPGGDIMAGTVLYDTIRAIREDGIEITTVALGKAASMAAILLQAGTTRVIGPTAKILIHESHMQSEGKISEMDMAVAFGKELQKTLVAILAERSKLSAAEIASKAKKGDWWLDAKSAVKFGFADRAGYR